MRASYASAAIRRHSRVESPAPWDDGTPVSNRRLDTEDLAARRRATALRPRVLPRGTPLRVVQHRSGRGEHRPQCGGEQGQRRPVSTMLQPFITRRSAGVFGHEQSFVCGSSTVRERQSKEQDMTCSRTLRIRSVSRIGLHGNSAYGQGGRDALGFAEHVREQAWMELVRFPPSAAKLEFQRLSGMQQHGRPALTSRKTAQGSRC